MTSGRDPSIDYLKGIGIFLVVWGHAMVPRSEYLYAFHMPLFFCISGYLFKSRDFGSFFKAKLRHLLIPFALFFVFSWGFQALVFQLLGRGQETLFDPGYQIVRFALGDSDAVNNSPLWFLTCLFCLALIYFFIDKIKQIWINTLVIVVLSSIGVVCSFYEVELPLKLQVSLTALPFFGAGHRWFLAKNSIPDSKYLLFTVPLFIIGSIYTTQLNIDLSGIEKVNMYANTIGNPGVFYIGGFFGTAAFVLIVRLFFQHFATRLITFLGENSLIILMVHYPLINVCRVLLENKVDIEHWWYALGVGMVVTAFCGVVVVVWRKISLTLS